MATNNKYEKELIERYEFMFPDKVGGTNVTSAYRGLMKKFHSDYLQGFEIKGKIKDFLDKYFSDLDYENIEVVLKTVSQYLTVTYDKYNESIGKKKNQGIPLEEYKKMKKNELLSRKAQYEIIDDYYNRSCDNFSIFIISAKSNETVDTIYNGIVSDLDKQLELQKYRNIVLKTLRQYVEGRNTENVELFNEAKAKMDKVNTISELEEINIDYEFVLKRNSKIFSLTDTLNRMVGKNLDDRVSEIINNAKHELMSLDGTQEEVFNKIFNKYSMKLKLYITQKDIYNELSELKRINKYSNFEHIDIDDIFNCNSEDEIKIIYSNLKERIINRITYTRNVMTKVLEFKEKYVNNKNYSFTIPFINKKIREYYNYYDPKDKDLTDLESKLSDLAEIIEKQREKDMEEVDGKIDAIINNLSKDYKSGIFIPNGKTITLNEIENIDTFGGFANFENRIINIELGRVLSDIYNYVADASNTLNKEKVKNKSERMKKIKLALNLCTQVLKFIKDNKEYTKKNASNYVDYKKLSKKMQKIKRINFISDDIDKIDETLFEIDSYLNNDLYNNEVIELVNNNRKR